MKAPDLFILCLLFFPLQVQAAQQIGEPLSVPVTVTVSGLVLCSFELGFCTDETVAVIQEEEEQTTENEPTAALLVEKAVP